MRRPLFWMTALLVGALMLTACAPGGGEGESDPGDTTTTEAVNGDSLPDDAAASSTTTDQQMGPIKIGLLAPITGNFAAPGQALVEGFELFWAQHGDQVAGREIEVFVEDTAGDPDTGLNKARLLVEQRGVHVLVGALAANVGSAVAEYIESTDVPYLIPVVANDNFTQRDRHPQVIRVAGFAASQMYHPAGQWAADTGIEAAMTLGSDYAFGHQSVAGFVNTFTDNGGEIVEQLWAPLGTQDFGPFIAQIQSQQPDAVFSLSVGGDALRFIQQWDAFGMNDSDIMLISTESALDQSLLPPMGEAAVGQIGFGRFPTGSDAESTTEFVNAYEEAYGTLPTTNAAALFSAGMWIVEAVEGVNGDVEDLEALIEGLGDVTLEDSPYGNLRMDEFGNPIFNVYAFEIQLREDGVPWMVPFETFTDVGQFWTYDVDEFLDHPEYSREYQGDGIWPEPNPEG